MNSILKLGLSIVAVGFGIELATKKGLTLNSESDNVQIPEANNVPKPNETENKTDITDNSGLNDGGDVV